jgi:hypothetical protein
MEMVFLVKFQWDNAVTLLCYPIPLQNKDVKNIEFSGNITFTLALTALFLAITFLGNENPHHVK